MVAGELGIKAKHRALFAEKEYYALKEPEVAYSPYFDGKKGGLSMKNRLISD